MNDGWSRETKNCKYKDTRLSVSLSHLEKQEQRKQAGDQSSISSCVALTSRCSKKQKCREPLESCERTFCPYVFATFFKQILALLFFFFLHWTIKHQIILLLLLFTIFYVLLFVYASSTILNPAAFETFLAKKLLTNSYCLRRYFLWLTLNLPSCNFIGSSYLVALNL